MTQIKVLMLGVGNTALALAQLYKMRHQGQEKSPDKDQNYFGGILLYGTTRSETKAVTLQGLGIEPLLDGGNGKSAGAAHSDAAIERLTELAQGALVLVSYPPDNVASASGPTDKRYGPALKLAKKIVYISSTGVYGEASGIIDEKIPCVSDLHSAPRLAAEHFWRERGACVLRAPGLYGPQTGLHKRLQAGTYRLPGDGTNYVSRIHLDDLANVIDAAFSLAAPASLYVAGDLKPSTHIEAVTWLCNRLGLPLPPSVPLQEVGPSLRGNRQIDSSCMRRELKVTLKYPTYIEGFGQCLAAEV